MNPLIETAMRPLSLVPTLIAIGFVAGCSEQPTGPRPLPGTPPSFAIQDGAHGGSPRLYFLPPMVPAPSYSGTFDPSQSPVVTICVLAGSACGATVTSFSGSAVKLDLAAQAYVASWKTKGAGLDPTKTYRIQVLVGATVLGYADVVVLSNGSQIKTVDKNQFVSVINGGVLKIRFRIEELPPPPPPPPPPGPWQNGDLITYNQDSWGSPGTTAALLLASYFDFIYPGGVQIGLPGNGFSAVFTSADAVLAYQPASGASGVFDNDLVDPVATSAGIFGGYALAVQLNVDLGDAHHLDGTAKLLFGDLHVCGLTATPGLNGSTVRQVLGVLNQGLGGGTTPYRIDDLAQLGFDLAQSFESGSVSLFAQDHLVNGACPGGPWQTGDLVTYNQVNWGTLPSAATALLTNNFPTLYPNGVEIGIPGPSGNSALWTIVDAILGYQPAIGSPAPLDNDLLDPTSTSSGTFGGNVLALQFDVDFANAGLLSGTASINFAGLRVCGLTATPNFNGMTVSQVLAQLNQALGGGATPYSHDDLDNVANELTQSFESGAPSTFAQQHLVNGACPGGWQNGALVTYSQDSWGGDPTTNPAAALLLNRFNPRYPAGMEVGLPGGTGFSMAFTTAVAVLAFLPASGAFSALNSDLVDPTSSASGTYGGVVLALQLSVDFADSRDITGISGLVFGDLRVCGLTATPAYNNLTVRQFLAAMNSALGGGAAAYNFDTTGPLTMDVSLAFEGGTPSAFAQAHLVIGACP